MSYRVFSPSLKRGSICRSHRLFFKEVFTYVINEAEREEYERGGHRVVCIPDGEAKNIVETRNWILRYCRDNDINRFIQVDDDISRILWIYERDLLDLSNEALDNVINEAFQMCDDFNVNLWGMNVICDPMAYSINKPLQFNRVICGTFSAFNRPPADINYDERFSLKEDFDIFLQFMHKTNRTLRFDFLGYLCDHLKMKGGCQLYRTTEKEEFQKKLLQKKWGNKIVKENTRNQDSFNMRISL